MWHNDDNNRIINYLPLDRAEKIAKTHGQDRIAVDLSRYRLPWWL